MKNTKASIDAFFDQKTFAVVGVSRNKDKFGNMIYREMKKRGLEVYGVNPQLDMIEGERCYGGLGALPVKVDAVIAVIPPQATLPIIDDMAKLSIKHLWLQQGADSPEAEQKALALGMNLVSGECMLMYLPPVESLHKFHRVLKKIFGGLPK
jgi:predicted CoA-binding protein